MPTIPFTIEQYISPINSRGKVRRGSSPYLHELALVVIAWNELHLQLSQLFCIVAGFSNMTTGLRIWHSTDNDRGQRKLLKEVLRGDLQHLPRVKNKPIQYSEKAIGDIKYILKEADKIAGFRNSTIHSPYLFAVDGKTITMKSHDFFMSPRAKELSGKDLLVEFKRQREGVNALTVFAQKIRLALYLIPEPQWPQKPSPYSTGRDKPQKNSVESRSK